MKSLRILSLALIAIPFLVGCETQDDRTLSEAQHCIDTANAANVDLCVNKVAGMTNQQSYVIRCASHFIAQNISAATLVEAFQNMKSATTNGVASTTYAIAYLLFDNTIPGHSINNALYDCGQSGATSLYKLVQLSNIGTTLGGGAIPNGDYADLRTAIQGFSGDYTAVGNMAVDIKHTFCDNGGSFNGTDVCNRVNQAYTNAGGDPDQIGHWIQTLLGS